MQSDKLALTLQLKHWEIRFIIEWTFKQLFNYWESLETEPSLHRIPSSLLVALGVSLSYLLVQTEANVLTPGTSLFVTKLKRKQKNGKECASASMYWVPKEKQLYKDLSSSIRPQKWNGKMLGQDEKVLAMYYWYFQFTSSAGALGQTGHGLRNRWVRGRQMTDTTRNGIAS